MWLVVRGVLSACVSGRWLLPCRTWNGVEIVPRYQFRCRSCSTEFEEKRSFAQSDDPAPCPSCDDPRSAKVFAAATFYTPGMAAKRLLEPNPAREGVAPAGHGASCACCGGR